MELLNTFRLISRRARPDLRRITIPAPDFGLIEKWVKTQKERHELARLSRHHPRILEDAGIAPETVYEKLRGGWDDVEIARTHARIAGSTRPETHTQKRPAD